MEIGGAESALIGMLQTIDYTRYDVDLFLHAHRGEMMQFIPKEVNLLPEIKVYAHIECSMMQALLDGCWGVFYGRLKAKWLFRNYLRRRGLSESAASFLCFSILARLASVWRVRPSHQLLRPS